jgi:hypothetical protein
MAFAILGKRTGFRIARLDETAQSGERDAVSRVPSGGVPGDPLVIRRAERAPMIGDNLPHGALLNARPL